MSSLGFSSFRELLDIWDLALAKEALEDRIKAMLEGPSFVFFFTRGDEVFGGGENARMTFAQMKSPDKEMPKDWANEASFLANNITKMVKGEMGQGVFYKKDLKEIKIITLEEALKKLTKQANEKSMIVGLNNKTDSLQSEE